MVILYSMVIWYSSISIFSNVKVYAGVTPCDSCKTLVNKPSFCSGSCDECHAHETFLKHLESFLETSLKHSGNTLNHETPLKHPWNFLFHETFMKHPWIIFEIPLKLPQNTLQSSLKLSWNTYVTSFKRLCNFLKTP